MFITACVWHSEPVATCFVLNPLNLQPWVMTYLTTAYDFSDLSVTFVYDVHLPFQAAINHNGLNCLLTILYYNVLFKIFIYIECDNFKISILNDITCLVVLKAEIM